MSRPQSTSRRRALVFAAVFSMFVAWEVVPPFDSPYAYEGRSYIEVASLLGDANEFVPDKYVAWKSQRLLSFWFLQASYEDNPNNDGKLSTHQLRRFERYFCIGTTGYNFKFRLYEHIPG
jgi:hypothetical protein